MDTFKFTGKIVLGKDSEKFHPIEKRDFQSGWTNTSVRFNCVSDTNRILCMTQGGKWKNDSKNVIKTFGKSTTDANGNTVKGDTIEISWAKRFDDDQINKVAGFRKFICDTGDTRMRYKLRDLVAAFENGTVTDEMMEEVGIDNLNDAKVALEKSQAKRRVFLSEWDFAEHLAKVVSSEKFKGKLFNIYGNYDVQYNADKDRFYTNYHVNKVILASDDAVPDTEFKIDFYYGTDAWDDSQYEDTGKCRVNGWVAYRDTNLKKTGFMPMTVTIKETDEKKLNGLNRKFAIDDGIKQIGLTLNVIEGSEFVEITMDMLDEETRDDIECGLLDFDTVKREMGGRAMGERVSELRFVELTPKKNKVQDTVYTIEDMHAAKAEQVASANADIDLFADDDDDDL